MSGTLIFDEQIRKNRSSRSINKGKERNCCFGCISKVWSSLPIPSINDVFTSGSASFWGCEMRSTEMRWMRCWIFSSIMDYVFIDHIKKFANRLHVQNNRRQKKTTPPPTTQWTFRIQSDATIKQIPRRPAVKSPINTINLWRQWKSFFSMSKDFCLIYSLYISIFKFMYIYIFKDRYHIIYPKLQDRFPIQLIHINCQETEARQEEGGLSTTGATTNSNTFSYGSRGGPRGCSPSKWLSWLI